MKITKLLKICMTVPLVLSVTEFAYSMNADEGVIGRFEVVAIRNASDVARPADMGPQTEEVIGQTITFKKDRLEMDGMSCQHWEVSMLLVPVINPEDPMLSDIHVPPAESSKSGGDQRISNSYNYNCEGESFLNVYQVDKRVIVIPWQNSSRYLIAEIPLNPDQVSTLQSQLKDMKFNEQDPTGVIDENTLRAISTWSNYRLGIMDGYRFKRSAITENLLDTLDVLE